MVELTKSIVNELALLEVKLGIAKQSLKDDHEDRILLEMEAVQLRGQLQRVVGRDLDGDVEGLQQDTFNALGPPLREWPSTATRLSFWMRSSPFSSSTASTRICVAMTTRCR